MAAPVISVVMPVYNSGEYLRFAVASILNQSFSDVELLCVDDGSTDSSLEQLQSFATQDPRVKVIRRDHEGAGAARNAGLLAAVGRYVYFMDSDDQLRPHAFQTLLDKAEATNADVVYFKSTVTYSPSIAWWLIDVRQRRLAAKNWNADLYLLAAIRARAFSFSPCLQFVRKGFLDQSGIVYPIQEIAEDTLFSIRVVVEAAKICFIRDKLFDRRWRPGSVSTGSPVIATVRSSLLNCKKIDSLMMTQPLSTQSRRALERILEKQWRYALDRFDDLPIQARRAIEPKNIFPTDMDFGRTFIEEARRNQVRRTIARRFRRKPRLVLEDKPPESLFTAPNSAQSAQRADA